MAFADEVFAMVFVYKSQDKTRKKKQITDDFRTQRWVLHDFAK